MGDGKTPSNVLRTVLWTLAVVVVGSGCQVSPAVSTSQLIRQRALLDFTGLLPAQFVDHLKVDWSVPRDWQTLPPKRSTIFTHQQYRSPSGMTGVGVAYVRLPIPLPASTIAWFAQREYLKQHSEQRRAKLVGRWSDRAGREWFEGENDKYHGTGYVMARGNEAWIVYSGYRLSAPPNAEEISISRRSAKTIVPKVE